MSVVSCLLNRWIDFDVAVLIKKSFDVSKRDRKRIFLSEICANVVVFFLLCIVPSVLYLFYLTVYHLCCVKKTVLYNNIKALHDIKSIPEIFAYLYPINLHALNRLKFIGCNYWE